MPKRLLIVDDEPNLLVAVSACLRSHGYEVATTSSGTEALAYVVRDLPDAMITDIRMPGLDGYELVRRLRGCSRTSLLPIIFLTVKDQKPDRVAGFQAGADGYVTKPFEPDELLAVVENILQRVERTQAEIERLVIGKPESPAIIQDSDLTQAEYRVAAAVARGRANKEIAAELGVSIRTVENHISHILSKKRFSNRVEIATYILTRASGSGP